MKLINSYKQISRSDIQLLSDKYGVFLPEEYAAFLLRHNGGRPEPRRYIKTGPKGEIYFDFEINVFFGIGKDDTSYDILTMFDIYCERIPEELLPIAHDGISNIICIGVDKQYLGKIYIWWADKEVDEGEEPNFDNITLMETSFSDFVNGFVQRT